MIYGTSITPTHLMLRNEAWQVVRNLSRSCTHVFECRSFYRVHLLVPFPVDSSVISLS